MSAPHRVTRATLARTIAVVAAVAVVAGADAASQPGWKPFVVEDSVYGNCCPLPSLQSNLTSFAEARCKFLCPWRPGGRMTDRFAFTFRGFPKSGTSVSLHLFNALLEAVADELHYALEVLEPKMNRVRPAQNFVPAAKLAELYNVSEVKEATLSVRGFDVVVDHVARSVVVVRPLHVTKHSPRLKPLADGRLPGLLVPVRDPRDRALSWFYFNEVSSAQPVPPGTCEPRREGWCEAFVENGLQFERSVVFNRHRFAGVFAFTYDMLSTDKPLLLASVLRWAGFRDDDVAAMGSRMEAIGRAWTRTPKGTSQQTVREIVGGKDASVKPTAGDVSTHLRAAALHTFADGGTLSGGDVAAINRMMCSVSPLHFWLFSRDGGASAVAAANVCTRWHEDARVPFDMRSLQRFRRKQSKRQQGRHASQQGQ